MKYLLSLLFQRIKTKKKPELHGRERWSPHKPEWWNRLHVLWTNAVTQPGYDENEWHKFAESLYRATGYKP